MNDWQKNRFHYDTLYDLVQRWRPIVDALSPEELAEFDYLKHIRTIEAFVHHDFRLPGAEHISYEDAVTYAQEALLQLPGWTQEKVNLMRISTEAFHVPLGMEQPVYQFVFKLASSVERLKAALSDGPYTFDRDGLGCPGRMRYLETIAPSESACASIARPARWWAPFW